MPIFKTRSDIEMLVAVAHTGSILGTARERGVTQPWISRVIRRLEERAGAPFFTRQRRGVTLTPLGQIAVKTARNVLAAMDDAEAAMGAPRAIKASRRLEVELSREERQRAAAWLAEQSDARHADSNLAGANCDVLTADAMTIRSLVALCGQASRDAAALATAAQYLRHWHRGGEE